MAGVGRKPVPTALKLITGNPGKRAINKNEPQPLRNLPDPPPHLTANAAAEWQRVAAELFDCGLLTRIDRATLAAYCQAYGRWVEAEEELNRQAEKEGFALTMYNHQGNLISNPVVGIADRAMAAMARYAIEFGMTPSARARITIAPKEDAQDPALKYFN